MGKQMTNTELELYRWVDEVLYYVWGPIGISCNPAARDEYQRYLPAVFTLLQEGMGPTSVSEYLDEVVTARMGLTARSAHSKSVAASLFEWKSAIYGKL